SASTRCARRSPPNGSNRSLPPYRIVAAPVLPRVLGGGFFVGPASSFREIVSVYPCAIGSPRFRVERTVALACRNSHVAVEHTFGFGSAFDGLDEGCGLVGGRRVGACGIVVADRFSHAGGE